MKLNQRTIKLLKQSPLLRAFPPEQMDALLKQARQHHLQEGETLFRQGERLDELFICTEGCIKLFHLALDGGEKIVDIVSPGHSFAEAMLFTEGQLCQVHAAALKQAEVVGINAAQFLGFLQTSPPLCFSVMGLLSQRIQWLLNEVDRLTLHNATFRLAFFLLETYRNPDTCNIISLNVPKHVVASRLSIRPETLSRILKNLTDRGLIAVRDHQVELVDVEGLKAMISIDA